jgi:hypothetical protein
MTSMISALTCKRVTALVICCAAAGGQVGCGWTIAGSAVMDSDSQPGAVVAATPLSELLLDRSRWPSDYPPRTLTARDAQDSMAAIDAVPPGGRVKPAECQPPVPTEIVAVEGSRWDGTALRLVLARGVGPLSKRRDQVTRCTSFSATTDTAGMWTVSVQMVPPPVVNVDDAFAFDLKQTGSSMFTALVLVGQVGDVRVTAQAIGSGAEQLDPAALDEIFTSQVQTLRRAR